MENRPFDESEHDDEDEVSVGKKKRPTNSFIKYLSGLRRQDSAEDTVESSSEQIDKPKRFARLFSKLFPAVVEKPAIDESTEPLSERSLFGVVKTEVAQTVPKSSQESATDREVSSMYEHSTLDHDSDTVSHIATPEVTGSAESAEAEQSTSPRLSESVPSVASFEAPDTESNISGHESQAQTVQSPAEFDRQFDPSILEVRPGATGSTIEQVQATSKEEESVVIQRGPGLALPLAAVGVEYLARKNADKKLEKRFNEKLDSSDKKTDKAAALQAELSKVIQENRQRVELLKQTQSEKLAEVKKPDTPPLAAVAEVVRPEKVPEKVVVSKQPEAAPPRAKITEADLAQRSNPDMYERPQTIMEKVAEAAEHDTPVERLFERSHEVKDEQQTQVGASSVGSIVSSQQAANALHTAKNTQSSSTGMSGQSAPLPYVSDEQRAKDYAQAMKMGFASAMVIIILGLFAYLMVN